MSRNVGKEVWTKIGELHAKGASYYAIAGELGITKTSVRYAVRKMSGKPTNPSAHKDISTETLDKMEAILYRISKRRVSLTRGTR